MTEESRSACESADNPVVPCRVAIVGAGYMAREHVRAFQDVPGVQITGVYSRTRSRAEELAAACRIPNVCDTAADLFERTEADLVVVSVPELSANEVCRACFEHSWTALIEKPAGYNLADAQAVEAAARSRGRRAYVALNRRHYGATRTVVGDLANLEGPRLIKVQDQEDPVTALQSGQPRLVVENWMYANSIHLVDYFRLLGRGKIVDVAPTVRWDPARPRYVAARITFDSGDIVLYEAIWEGPGPWAVSVNTPAKRWEMRPLERASYQLAGKRVLEPEVFAGDIRDGNGVRVAMKDCDAVLHLAALIGIPYSYRSPETYVDTNIKGILNVVQAARGPGRAKSGAHLHQRSLWNGALRSDHRESPAARSVILFGEQDQRGPDRDVVSQFVRDAG